ncbi:MAG TPA: isochorismatase family cysteine hydrolase [Burkholderiales bacterium]|nr:isochorismatase family cysteine hydrolase [Burkholderiales bacterium]
MTLTIDPKRTAFLLLDVQMDLVQITPGLEERHVLSNMAAVLREARRRNAAVIHITASVRPDFLDLPKDNPLWDGIRKARQLIIGTPGAAIHPSVKPFENELVLNKTCVDPFLTTNLGQALQNADANTLVLMGLWTNYVVEATARHASDMGYRVLLVEDACASNTAENHAFAIRNILPTLCYVVTAKDVLDALK